MNAICASWASEEEAVSSSAMWMTVLIDRDGVLVDLPDRYAVSEDSIRPIAGVGNALRRLKRHGFRLIVVTNQSGVGRGLVTLPKMLAVNEHILRSVDPERRIIDHYIVCPHSPEERCSCRKPLTGGIRAAEHRLGPLTNGWFVGDQMSDLLCGSELGMRLGLVLTGHGRKAAEKVSEYEGLKVTIGKNLDDLSVEITKGV